MLPIYLLHCVVPIVEMPPVWHSHDLLLLEPGGWSVHEDVCLASVPPSTVGYFAEAALPPKLEYYEIYIELGCPELVCPELAEDGG